MVRRTASQHKTDDHAFPIRVKVLISHHDRALWWGLNDWLTIWMCETGPLRCAPHSGCVSLGD